MATVSLCMIVRNEEEVLARCLDSVADVVDEIVIVDTGSTDRTREIAARYTDRIYDFSWIDDFAAARNEAFSHATMDYQMWLDADDMLMEADREAFRQLKETLDGSVDVVMMRYHAAFDEQGNPSLSYYRERLLRREMGFVWDGAVHEVIVPAGNILYSEIAVAHCKPASRNKGDSDRNLRIYERLLAQGAAFGPRQQYYYARELCDHGRYADAVAQLEAFLAKGQGWVENNIEACGLLARCYQMLGRDHEALSALYRSFAYDLPRAEICCAIGQCYCDWADWQKAVFWYKMAASRPMNEQSGGFCQPDCYGFLPYLQLCVCSDRLGDYEAAERYNEMAAARKPEDPAVKHNRQYFATLRDGK